MQQAHEAIGWVLIGVNAIAGVWALSAHRVVALRGRPVWVAIIAGQLLAFASAISGALLSSGDGPELDGMHALYGFSAIIAVAILYSYRASPYARQRLYLMYGLGALFIMGLGIRNLFL